MSQFQRFLKGCDIKSTNLELLRPESPGHAVDPSFMKETFYSSRRTKLPGEKDQHQFTC